MDVSSEAGTSFGGGVVGRVNTGLLQDSQLVGIVSQGRDQSFIATVGQSLHNIQFSAQLRHDQHDQADLALSVLAGVICICFLGADLIKRVLGDNGMQILTKFMGMVLLAIAMSIFAMGAKGLLPGLAG